MEEDGKEAIDAGCEAFLPKPIETQSFKNTIALILSAYSPKYFQ